MSEISTDTVLFTMEGDLKINSDDAEAKMKELKEGFGDITDLANENMPNLSSILQSGMNAALKAVDQLGSRVTRVMESISKGMEVSAEEIKDINEQYRTIRSQQEFANKHKEYNRVNLARSMRQYSAEQQRAMDAAVPEAFSIARGYARQDRRKSVQTISNAKDLAYELFNASADYNRAMMGKLSPEHSADFHNKLLTGLAAQAFGVYRDKTWRAGRYGETGTRKASIDDLSEMPISPSVRQLFVRSAKQHGKLAYSSYQGNHSEYLTDDSYIALRRLLGDNNMASSAAIESGIAHRDNGRLILSGGTTKKDIQDRLLPQLYRNIINRANGSEIVDQRTGKSHFIDFGELANKDYLSRHPKARKAYANRLLSGTAGRGVAAMEDILGLLEGTDAWTQDNPNRADEHIYEGKKLSTQFATYTHRPFLKGKAPIISRISQSQATDWLGGGHWRNNQDISGTVQMVSLEGFDENNPEHNKYIDDLFEHGLNIDGKTFIAQSTHGIGDAAGIRLVEKNEMDRVRREKAKQYEALGFRGDIWQLFEDEQLAERYKRGELKTKDLGKHYDAKNKPWTDSQDLGIDFNGRKVGIIDMSKMSDDEKKKFADGTGWAVEDLLPHAIQNRGALGIKGAIYPVKAKKIGDMYRALGFADKDGKVMLPGVNGQFDASDYDMLVDISQVKNILAYMDQNGILPASEKANEMLTGLLRIEGLRAKTDFDVADHNQSALGRQAMSYLRMNPQAFLTQYQHGLEVVQELENGNLDAIRKYVFANPNEDALAKQMHGENAGAYLTQANVQKRIDAKKQGIIRQMMVGAFDTFKGGDIPVLPLATTPWQALIETNGGKISKETIDAVRNIYAKAGQDPIDAGKDSGLYSEKAIAERELYRNIAENYTDEQIGSLLTVADDEVIDFFNENSDVVTYLRDPGAYGQIAKQKKNKAKLLRPVYDNDQFGLSKTGVVFSYHTLDKELQSADFDGDVVHAVVDMALQRELAKGVLKTVEAEGSSIVSTLPEGIEIKPGHEMEAALAKQNYATRNYVGFDSAGVRGMQIKFDPENSPLVRGQAIAAENQNVSTTAPKTGERANGMESEDVMGIIKLGKEFGKFSEAAAQAVSDERNFNELFEDTYNDEDSARSSNLADVDPEDIFTASNGVKVNLKPLKHLGNINHINMPSIYMGNVVGGILAQREWRNLGVLNTEKNDALKEALIAENGIGYGDYKEGTYTHDLLQANRTMLGEYISGERVEITPEEQAYLDTLIRAVNVEIAEDANAKGLIPHSKEYNAYLREEYKNRGVRTAEYARDLFGITRERLKAEYPDILETVSQAAQENMFGVGIVPDDGTYDPDNPLTIKPRRVAPKIEKKQEVKKEPEKTETAKQQPSETPQQPQQEQNNEQQRDRELEQALAEEQAARENAIIQQQTQKKQETAATAAAQPPIPPKPPDNNGGNGPTPPNSGGPSGPVPPGPSGPTPPNNGGGPGNGGGPSGADILSQLIQGIFEGQKKADTLDSFNEFVEKSAKEFNQDIIKGQAKEKDETQAAKYFGMSNWKVWHAQDMKDKLIEQGILESGSLEDRAAEASLTGLKLAQKKANQKWALAHTKQILDTLQSDTEASPSYAKQLKILESKQESIREAEDAVRLAKIDAGYTDPNAKENIEKGIIPDSHTLRRPVKYLAKETEADIQQMEINLDNITAIAEEQQAKIKDTLARSVTADTNQLINQANLRSSGVTGKVDQKLFDFMQQQQGVLGNINELQKNGVISEELAKQLTDDINGIDLDEYRENLTKDYSKGQRKTFKQLDAALTKKDPIEQIDNYYNDLSERISEFVQQRQADIDDFTKELKKPETQKNAKRRAFYEKQIKQAQEEIDRFKGSNEEIKAMREKEQADKAFEIKQMNQQRDIDLLNKGNLKDEQDRYAELQKAKDRQAYQKQIQDERERIRKKKGGRTKQERAFMNKSVKELMNEYDAAQDERDRDRLLARSLSDRELLSRFSESPISSLDLNKQKLKDQLKSRVDAIKKKAEADRTADEIALLNLTPEQIDAKVEEETARRYSDYADRALLNTQGHRARFSHNRFASHIQQRRQDYLQTKITNRDYIAQRNKMQDDLAEMTPNTEAYTQQQEAINNMNQAIQDNQKILDNYGKNGTGATVAGVFDTIGEAANRLVMRLGRRAFQKALRETIQFVKQFDAQMTEIQMISMKSDEEMEDVRSKTINKALNLRTSVSNVATTEAALYRQGLSDKEVSQRTDSIIKFATVAGIKTQEATKIVTTALQNDMVASCEQAMDALVALGDNAATTASEISKGFQKAAATAKVAGVSYAELTTLLTIGTSKTQLSGTQIGTALNTIMTRMRKVSTSNFVADQNGETTTLNDMEIALRSVGIELRKDNQTFKTAYEVLYELSTVWESLSDVQKSVVTNAVAGTRQTNIFSTLMEGMSEDGGETVRKYLELVEGSEGITDKKYDVYAQSLAASLDTLRTSYDALVESFNANGGLKSAINGLSELLQLMASANKATDGATGLVTVLATLVGIIGGSMVGGPLGAFVFGAGAAIGLGGVLGTLFGTTDNRTQQEKDYEGMKAYNAAQTDYSNNIKNRVADVRKLGEEYDKLTGAEKEAAGVNLQNALLDLATAFPSLSGVVLDAIKDINNWEEAVNNAENTAKGIIKQNGIITAHNVAAYAKAYNTDIFENSGATQTFDTNDLNTAINSIHGSYLVPSEAITSDLSNDQVSRLFRILYATDNLPSEESLKHTLEKQTGNTKYSESDIKTIMDWYDTSSGVIMDEVGSTYWENLGNGFYVDPVNKQAYSQRDLLSSMNTFIENIDAGYNDPEEFKEKYGNILSNFVGYDGETYDVLKLIEMLEDEDGLAFQTAYRKTIARVLGYDEYPDLMMAQTYGKEINNNALDPIKYLNMVAGGFVDEKTGKLRLDNNVYIPSDVTKYLDEENNVDVAEWNNSELVTRWKNIIGTIYGNNKSLMSDVWGYDTFESLWGDIGNNFAYAEQIGQGENVKDYFNSLFSNNDFVEALTTQAKDTELQNIDDYGSSIADILTTDDWLVPYAKKASGAEIKLAMQRAASAEILNSTYDDEFHQTEFLDNMINLMYDLANGTIDIDEWTEKWLKPEDYDYFVQNGENKKGFRTKEEALEYAQANGLSAANIFNKSGTNAFQSVSQITSAWGQNYASEKNTYGATLNEWYNDVKSHGYEKAADLWSSEGKAETLAQVFANNQSAGLNTVLFDEAMKGEGYTFTEDMYKNMLNQDMSGRKTSSYLDFVSENLFDDINKGIFNQDFLESLFTDPRYQHLVQTMTEMWGEEYVQFLRSVYADPNNISFEDKKTAEASLRSHKAIQAVKDNFVNSANYADIESSVTKLTSANQETVYGEISSQTGNMLNQQKLQQAWNRIKDGHGDAEDYKLVSDATGLNRRLIDQSVASNNTQYIDTSINGRAANIEEIVKGDLMGFAAQNGYSYEDIFNAQGVLKDQYTLQSILGTAGVDYINSIRAYGSKITKNGIIWGTDEGLESSGEILEDAKDKFKNRRYQELAQIYKGVTDYSGAQSQINSKSDKDLLAVVQENADQINGMESLGATTDIVSGYFQRLYEGRTGTLSERYGWLMDKMFGDNWQNGEFDMANAKTIYEGAEPAGQAIIHEMFKTFGNEDLWMKAMRGEDVDLDEATKAVMKTLTEEGFTGLRNAAERSAAVSAFQTGTASDKLSMLTGWMNTQSNVGGANEALSRINAGYGTVNDYGIIGNALGIDQNTARKLMKTQSGKKLIEDSLKQAGDDISQIMADVIKSSVDIDPNMTTDDIASKLEAAGQTALANWVEAVGAAADAAGNIEFEFDADATQLGLQDSFEAGYNNMMHGDAAKNVAQAMISAVTGYTGDIVSDYATAEATYGSSAEELVRYKYLKEQGTISQEDYDALVADLNQEKPVDMLLTSAQGMSSSEDWDTYFNDPLSAAMYSMYRAGQIGKEGYLGFLNAQAGGYGQQYGTYDAIAGSMFSSDVYNNGTLTAGESLMSQGAALVTGDGLNNGLTQQKVELLSQYSDNWAKLFQGFREGKNADDMADVIEEINKEMDSNKTANVLKYSKSVGKVVDEVKAIKAGGMGAAKTVGEIGSAIKGFQNARYMVDKYKAGSRTNKTTEFLSSYFGIDKETLKSAEGVLGKQMSETLEGALNESEADFMQEQGDLLTSLLSDELAQGIDLGTIDVNGNVDGSGIIAGANNVSAQAIAALLTAAGYGIRLVSSGTEAHFEVVGGGKGAAPSGGGGGGGGKSAIQKWLEDRKREDQLWDHQLKMAQLAETKYGNAGELTNQNKAYQNEIDLRTRRNKYIEKELKAVREKMGEVAKGSDDWFSLRDRLLSLEEALEENKNSIDELNKSIKENRNKINQQKSAIEQDILGVIEANIQKQRDMLDGRVTMEDTILNAIKARYQAEWDLIKKDIEKKREALEKEKSLINERLQARKESEDEAKKYEELAEYQRQLAMISMDSTRTKDAAELRKKIEDLQKEIGWDIAEKEAQTQEQSIQDQIDAYDTYVETGDEDLNNFLADANNFASEVEKVMSMSQNKMFAWLKANCEDYKNALEDTQLQMVNTWTDTFKQMKGITDTYWKEIAKIMTSKESFINFMKTSDEYKNASAAEKATMIYDWSLSWDNWQAAIKSSSVPAHKDKGLGETGGGGSGGGGGGGGGGGNKDETVTWAQVQAAKAALDEQKAKVKAAQDAYNNAIKELQDAISKNLSTTYIKQCQDLIAESKKILDQELQKQTALQAAYDSARSKWGKQNAKPQGNPNTPVQYKAGGIVDFTGPAWVDGTKARPEAFLDADDTALIRQMLDEAKYVKQAPFRSNIDSRSFMANSGFRDVYITLNEAKLENDADYEMVARKVGEVFVKELNNQGMHTAVYSF